MDQGTRLSRRSVLGLVAAGGVSFWLTGRVDAARSLSVGVASIDPIYTQFYVALDRGYFRAEGLDVSYVNTQSGPRTKQVLAAKEIGVGTSGTNDAIALTLAGKPTNLILAMDTRITYANILTSRALYDSGKVRTIEDLKGKTLACTQLQSATWLMAVFILDQAKIRDQVAVRGLGDLLTMLGAVKSGQVEATVATVSMVDKAVQEGWGVPIFDISVETAWKRYFGGNVPGIAAYVLEESVERHADVIQAYVNAIVKATDFCKATSALDLARMMAASHLKAYGDEALLRAMQLYKRIWAYDNLITEEDYQRLLSIMAGRQLKEDEVRRVGYRQAVNMSFVRRARKL
jgi:NitT/TauT family transport system substrate-binding protein